MNKKGYIAGKLFKKGDQNQRILEKKILSEIIPSVEWFNPLTDNPANDKSKLPTANSIFTGDTNKIIESDYIIAELDDEDSGTMMELGVAYGINLILNLISYFVIKEGMSIEEAVQALFKSVPRKQVYAHLTDIRIGTSGDYNEKYVPFGVNQYVVGGIEEMGQIYTDFNELISDVKKEVELNDK